MNDVESDRWITAAVRKYSEPLTLYALHMTGDIHLARDVVQEAFIKLCSQNEKKVGERTREWLYTVCRHRALDYIRKGKRMTSLDSRHDEVEGDGNVENHGVENENRILQAVNNLPNNQKEVIRLKFLHGQSYKEISRVTGLSESNVGFLIHTGIQTLRAQWKTLAAQ